MLPIRIIGFGLFDHDKLPSGRNLQKTKAPFATKTSVSLEIRSFWEWDWEKLFRGILGGGLIVFLLSKLLWKMLWSLQFALGFLASEIHRSLNAFQNLFHPIQKGIAAMIDPSSSWSFSTLPYTP